MTQPSPALSLVAKLITVGYCHALTDSRRDRQNILNCKLVSPGGDEGCKGDSSTEALCS